MKGKAGKKWSKLTEDDLDRISGSREELIGLLQERYGKTCEEIEKEVDSLGVPLTTGRFHGAPWRIWKRKEQSHG